MDFVALFITYLKNQQYPPSPLTIKNYSADIKRFLRWLEKKKVSALTVKNYLIDLRQFTTWLEEWNERTAITYTFFADKKVLNSYTAYLKQNCYLAEGSISRKLSSLRKYNHWITMYTQR